MVYALVETPSQACSVMRTCFQSRVNSVLHECMAATSPLDRPPVERSPGAPLANASLGQTRVKCWVGVQARVGGWWGRAPSAPHARLHRQTCFPYSKQASSKQTYWPYLNIWRWPSTQTQWLVPLAVCAALSRPVVAPRCASVDAGDVFPSTMACAKRAVGSGSRLKGSGTGIVGGGAMRSSSSSQSLIHPSAGRVQHRCFRSGERLTYNQSLK